MKGELIDCNDRGVFKQCVRHIAGRLGDPRRSALVGFVAVMLVIRAGDVRDQQGRNFPKMGAMGD